MGKELTLALVDDRAEDAQSLSRALQTYFAESAPTFTPRLRAFSSKADFLAAYEPGRFELIFLDIFLGDGTGMEIARTIRRSDPAAALIFLTTSPDFAVESYDVYAAGYLLKPLAQNRAGFRRTLTRVLKRFAPAAVFAATSMYRPVRVPYAEILYLDTSSTHRIGKSRNIMLHLVNGKACSIDLSFAEAWERLQGDARFVECSSHLVVNLEHVKKITDEGDFLMADGTQLPISRRKKKESEAAFFHFLLREGA